MGDAKAGLYGGFTIGGPDGFGGGVYFDSHGNFYPQGYVGTPGFGISGGYSSDPHSLSTGPSVSGGAGGLNYSNTLPPGTAGYGVGTPGVGATYGVDGNQIVKQTPDNVAADVSHYADTQNNNLNVSTQDPQMLARYDEMHGTHTLDDYNQQMYGSPDDSAPPPDWDKPGSRVPDKKKDKLKWTPMTGCPTCPDKPEDYPRYPGYKAMDGTVTKGSPHWNVK